MFLTETSIHLNELVLLMRKVNGRLTNRTCACAALKIVIYELWCLRSFKVYLMFHRVYV